MMLFSHSSFQLAIRSAPSQLPLIRCQSHPNNKDEFVPASLLLSETLGHYRGLKYGVEERNDVYNRDSLTLPPLEDSKKNITDIEDILSRYRSPMLFLTASCDRDYLLPIGVDEHAIEALSDASRETKDEDYPNQFQFVKNLVQRFGYEVYMAKITKRVRRTYFAQVYLSKPGEPNLICIDICPSDAINIAVRCMAPVYVSKQMVTTFAIQIAYTMKRNLPLESVYGVTLDSPADDLDKEICLVQNLHLAVLEERYNDAAFIREQLNKLRKKWSQWHNLMYIKDLLKHALRAFQLDMAELSYTNPFNDDIQTWSGVTSIFEVWQIQPTAAVKMFEQDKRMSFVVDSIKK